MPTSDAAPAEQFDDLVQQRQADLMGMWIFLATELLLFGGLFAAFTVYRLEYVAGFGGAAHHLDLMLGTINTVVLLTSGLTMTLAERAVNAHRRALALQLLAATLALGAVFLTIKGYEWHHEIQKQLMPGLGLPFNYPGDHAHAAQMFFNFYFAMTGLHAAHMLVGLGLLVTMLVLVARWRESGRLSRQIQIMSLYWAFVDIVWVFVFTTLYLLRI